MTEEVQSIVLLMIASRVYSMESKDASRYSRFMEGLFSFICWVWAMVLIFGLPK